jgi:hypothetical protein
VRVCVHGEKKRRKRENRTQTEKEESNRKKALTSVFFPLARTVQYKTNFLTFDCIALSCCQTKTLGGKKMRNTKRNKINRP